MVLTPNFDLGAIEKELQAFVQETEKRILASLRKVGEEFVRAARAKSTSAGHPDDLTSSIGYVITNNGRIIEQNIAGNANGTAKAKEVAQEAASQQGEGFALIGFAGDEQAALFESQGKDVITGSTPGIEEIMRTITNGIEGS